MGYSEVRRSVCWAGGRGRDRTARRRHGFAISAVASEDDFATIAAAVFAATPTPAIDLPRPATSTFFSSFSVRTLHRIVSIAAVLVVSSCKTVDLREGCDRRYVVDGGGTLASPATPTRSATARLAR